MPDFDADDIVKINISQPAPVIKKVHVGSLLTFTTVLNIGSNARLVALPNGFKIEVKNSSNVWVEQVEYTEP